MTELGVTEDLVERTADTLGKAFANEWPALDLVARAVLAAVVPEVRAQVLREAADAWDQADRDGSLGEFSDKYYTAGHNLPSLWLEKRAEEAAREIGGVEQ